MTRGRALQVAGIAAGALAFTSLAPGRVAAADATDAPGATIDVAVKNWSFTPSTITAHVGKPTTLRFKSSEGVHGVESADIGLESTTIMPGKTVEATFTPTKAGTFEVHCTIYCGAGHDKMKFTVKVLK